MPARTKRIFTDPDTGAAFAAKRRVACFSCGSRDVQSGPVVMDGDASHQCCQCNACGAPWIDQLDADALREFLALKSGHSRKGGL
ncbi:MAG: hypothetical protein IT463_00085 [Planctomycetes bacterium]|nr:hypothetical protein [Planctomycetota bacterium]